MDELNTEPSNGEMQGAQNAQDTATALEPAPRDFQELSLAEVVGQLVRHPVQAVTAMRQTLQRPLQGGTAGEDLPILAVGRSAPKGAAAPKPAFDWQTLQPLLASGSAFMLALLGSLILVTSNSPDSNGNLLLGAIPLLLGATLLAIIAARTYHFAPLPPLAVEEPPTAFGTGRAFVDANRLRITLAGVAVILALGSWVFNTPNQFTQVGVFFLVMSLVIPTAGLLDRD